MRVSTARLTFEAHYDAPGDDGELLPFLGLDPAEPLPAPLPEPSNPFTILSMLRIWQGGEEEVSPTRTTSRLGEGLLRDGLLPCGGLRRARSRLGATTSGAADSPAGGEGRLDGDTLRLRDDGDLRWTLSLEKAWCWNPGGLEGLPDGGRASSEEPGVTASNADPSGDDPTLDGLGVSG